MIATQSMPVDVFGLGRRRSSLGLSALFGDHQVPQFSLDTMLGESATPLTPSVLHEHATPDWEQGSFGAVPSLSPPGVSGGGGGGGGAPFFSHEAEPTMMLCDLGLGYDILGDLKAVKKEGASDPSATPATPTTAMTAAPPAPSTPATPATAGAEGIGVAPKAVLRADALAHWHAGPAPSSPASDVASSCSSSRSPSPEPREPMATTPDHPEPEPPHATRGVTALAAAAAAAAAAATPGGARAAKTTAPSKRSRKDANKCATVLAAMPKPPRRNRGEVSRLDEMTRHMSPERARLEKNRQSAKECRMRKKEYVGNLEKKISELEAREAARIAAMNALRAQLAALQKQVAGGL